MARRSRAGSKTRARKASPAKGRKSNKTAKIKTAKATRSRTVLKSPSRRSRNAPDLLIQLDLRTKQLEDALARQTPTSEILRVIRQSPADVQPVFDAIVVTAVRLLRCDGS